MNIILNNLSSEANLISIIEWKDNIYYVCTLQAKNGATREKDQVKLIKWIENNV